MLLSIAGKLNLKEARLAEDAEGFDGGSGALGCEIAALAAEEEDARNFEQWQYLHDELEALQARLNTCCSNVFKCVQLFHVLHCWVRAVYVDS